LGSEIFSLVNAHLATNIYMESYPYPILPPSCCLLQSLHPAAAPWLRACTPAPPISYSAPAARLDPCAAPRKAASLPFCSAGAFPRPLGCRLLKLGPLRAPLLSRPRASLAAGEREGSHWSRRRRAATSGEPQRQAPPHGLVEVEPWRAEAACNTLGVNHLVSGLSTRLTSSLALIRHT